MSKLQPYVHFNGDCAEAMRAYEKILGGKLNLMLAGDSPAAKEFGPGSEDRVLHSSLDLGDGALLLASDWMAPSPYPGKHGIELSLTYPTKAEAERVFKALAEGGRITMPLDKTFWSEAFGMLVDRFGTSWMVGIEH